jgi:hypothetical protein
MVRATSTAGVTVRVVAPERLDVGSVAEIVVDPLATPVASPPATVATPTDDDAHVTCAVMSSVDWSLYVPVAANCWVRPEAIDGADGVTATESSLAAVTVSLPVAETPLATCRALIVAVPTATAVTLPLDETVATAVDEEDQLSTCGPRTRLVPSLNVAVAV